MVRGLLVSVVLFGLISGQDQMRYLVTLPAVLYDSNMETVCVHLRSPSANNDLTVTLRTLATTLIIMSRSHTGDQNLQCSSFKVPPPTGTPDEVATVEVSVGGTVESKKVLIRPPEMGTFIQTDKPIYQPGHTVMIRIVRFNKNLVADGQAINLIELKDSVGNRIGQWTDVRPRGGIVDLTYTLASEIALGEYTVTVKDEKPLTFKVEEYVKPRFALNVDVPRGITILQKSFSLSVCAIYTIGKPVDGHVTGTLCREALPNSGTSAICKTIAGRTDAHGCYTAQIDTDFLRLKSHGYQNFVNASASLTEQGTDAEMQDQKRIPISATMATVVFSGASSTYRQGILYRGEMSLKAANGSPMPNEDLVLYVNGQRRDEAYTTDEDGRARFSLDTSSWTETTVTLRGQYVPEQPLADTGDVEPIYNQAYGTASRFSSYLKSQLKIRGDPSSVSCGEKTQLLADFVIDPSEVTERPEYIQFFYLVISNYGITQHSELRHLLPLDGDIKGLVSVPLTSDTRLAPSFTLLIYAVLPTGGLIADSRKVSVNNNNNNHFPNKVSLRFSEEEVLPGSKLELHVRASPGSLCSVRAVDKSILLLAPDAESAEDTVNGLLSRWVPQGYPPKVQEYPTECFGTWPVIDEALVDDSFLRPSLPTADTFSLFERAGMKVLTNWEIRTPFVCDSFPIFWITNMETIGVSALDGASDLSGPSDPAQPTAPTVIRQDFSETWLFDLQSVGSAGEANISLTAPDSITQWVADAFCTGSDGIGFSSQETVTVSQGFFLEMLLPFSVKRGESFVLKAVAFNDLNQCVKIRINLLQTEDFDVEECDGCSYESCLCSNPSFTATWIITPKKLGFIELLVSSEALAASDLCDGQKPVIPEKGQSDAVRKRLKVEPEGVRVEKTHGSLLCASDNETINVQTPELIVASSESAMVTVIGDVMGACLTNMGDLLKMPYGCGEQNMVNFAPNIAVLDYLTTTGQLTNEVSQRAKAFLSAGYARQLKYKRADGSYSAFGNADPSGNTWLTAFVAQSFNAAKQHTFIDDRHTQDALQWLTNLQQDDGCFRSVGKLLNNDLQGGQDSDLSLAAYVFMVFLEVKNPDYDSVLEKAKLCLDRVTAPGSSLYSKALSAHAFTLAGDQEKRQILLDQLDKLAKTSESGKYWSSEDDVPDGEKVWSAPRSAAVEITAYVLQAELSAPNPSSGVLGVALPMVRWLAAQQNPYGGFGSTKDTVVALQALCKYEMLTFSPDSSPVITVTNSNGFNHVFTVKSDNRLLLQRKHLPDIPGDYSVSVTGSGCALVQFVLRYNIPQPDTGGRFSLSAETKAINCPPHPLPKFALTLTFSYTGTREASNMVVIEVDLLTGYVALQEVINDILTVKVIKRTEITKSSLIIYAEEPCFIPSVDPDAFLPRLTSTPVTVSFELEQESPVKNLKPAMIRIYDYYKTEERAEVSYTAPCQ